MTPKPTDLVPGDRIRAILERAAHLDASTVSGMSRNELQKIAHEAGISPAAFEQAMLEELSPLIAEEPVPETKWWRREIHVLKGLWSGVANILVGGAFGAWLSQASLYEARGNMMMASCLMLGFALYRSIAGRKEKDIWSFQTTMVTMFAALWAVYDLSSVHTDPRLVMNLPLTGLIATFAGTAFLRLHILLQKPGRDPDNAVPLTSAS